MDFVNGECVVMTFGTERSGPEAADRSIRKLAKLSAP
jgi:hypothetical protein